VRLYDGAAYAGSGGANGAGGVPMALDLVPLVLAGIVLRYIDGS
jgi:hypothetical protein